ncbi:DNA mismatch endonuclease Vsr [Bacteroides caecigallinarum]|uniref:very short patch repair endonuclease n=1 Tax=Bacteroides caecigallinarum TaxID=1411144 RepID=UPI00195BD3F6|nr:very short patch repair endonuclease [Bacteroides caecigallinarum]MBM6864834.1 DNA mismatch endonuclease Vsr [Bacteroides caecigallinarum]
MSDVMNPEQRSRCMSHIKSKNTKPEIIVRKELFKRGFRFRINITKLPGHPDIVLTKYRTVIFVNGCFWHGHEGCKYFVLPKSNIDFWKSKIERNQKRDIEVQRELAKMGWHCITIWECQLKPNIKDKTLESLDYTLNHIYLTDRCRKEYKNDEEINLIAAEQQHDYK